MGFSTPQRAYNASIPSGYYRLRVEAFDPTNNEHIPGVIYRDSLGILTFQPTEKGDIPFKGMSYKEALTSYPYSADQIKTMGKGAENARRSRSIVRRVFRAVKRGIVWTIALPLALIVYCSPVVLFGVATGIGIGFVYVVARYFGMG